MNYEQIKAKVEAIGQSFGKGDEIFDYIDKNVPNISPPYREGLAAALEIGARHKFKQIMRLLNDIEREGKDITSNKE